MIIDFHTHTFPDKIAAQTIAFLAEKGGVTPYREGTLDSLKRSMALAGVTHSVVLPVATAAKQVASINRTGFAENGVGGVYFAGAIHPDTENVGEVLDAIKAAGLFGIKLHPDYQGVYFDDPRYLRIMQAAAERGLITVTHAGLDVGYPEDIHCTPERVLAVLESLKGLIDGKLVLAHMGSYGDPDTVLEKLVGRPVYMDTSAVLDKYPEKCAEIIRAHGADRILFATDSPWGDQARYVALIDTMGLSAEEKEKVCSGNARRLLGLA